MSFSILRPERGYARTPPGVFNAFSDYPDILTYFIGRLNESEAICPAEAVLSLEGAYLCDGKHVLDSHRNWVTETTVDLALADSILASLRQVLGDGHDVSTPLAAEAVRVVCLTKAGAEAEAEAEAEAGAGAGAGAGNYGHFIAEIAPKFVHLVQMASEQTVVILPEESLRFGEIISATIKALQLRVNIYFVREASFYAIPKLNFVTHISQHDFRKSPTLLEWRQLIFAQLGVLPTPTRKLLVRRALGKKRNFSNSDEVERALVAHRFEVVYPGELTFADQVRLFASASHVIGGLGAGLTNILFCDSLARVFMILPDMMDYFFWDISCLLKQEFNWFFADPWNFTVRINWNPIMRFRSKGLWYRCKKLAGSIEGVQGFRSRQDAIRHWHRWRPCSIPDIRSAILGQAFASIQALPRSDNADLTSV